VYKTATKLHKSSDETERARRETPTKGLNSDCLGLRLHTPDGKSIFLRAMLTGDLAQLPASLLWTVNTTRCLQRRQFLVI